MSKQRNNGMMENSLLCISKHPVFPARKVSQCPGAAPEEAAERAHHAPAAAALFVAVGEAHLAPRQHRLAQRLQRRARGDRKSVV